MGELTTLLQAAGDGDATAIGQLFSMLYPELKQLAHQRVRRMQNKTVLDTTSLVHESYLKLLKGGNLSVENRGHFLAYAARVMRSVVVDMVRQGRAQQRGGDNMHVTLNSNVLDSVESSADEIIRLHEYLDELKNVDERLVSVVELRYFAGLENSDIAQCLGVTDRTVRRDLEKARLLFIDEIGRSDR